MGHLDKYYRAFKSYRAATKPDGDLSKRRKLYKGSPKGDLLQVVDYNCTVDEDWISAIETGLLHIGKAIDEERQFIRSNGEVKPIEKVKSVSRESVEHLSKHSNLITRLPEDGDVIPDGLYTVERLTDYAVYENRFLYALLLYARDFAAYRYDKITGFSSLYEGEYRAERTVSSGKRKAQLKIDFKEEIKDDAFMRENSPLSGVILRIDGILKTINAYLCTPLMEFVAKSPLLKPPITETNVLKMNKNFKGAMQLYYFLNSYEGQGFKVERLERVQNPLNSDVADEFAEVGELVSFLTYGHGTGVTARLEERYLMEEERKKQEQERLQAEKMEGLRRRIRANGGEAEEYALMLEKRVRALEKENSQLEAARAEVEALTKKCGVAERERDGLSEKITALNKDYTARIAEMKADFASQTERLNLEKQEEIKRLTSEFEAASKSLESELSEKNERIETLELSCEKAENGRVLAEAKLNVFKSEHGLITDGDGLSSEEGFDELERQYAAFKALFKQEWKKAKKKIKSEVYGKKE